jgi:hypothetical protein
MISALSSLMAPDFVFVDSLGNEVRGAEKMTAGWRAYFTMCPDYWIRVRDSAPTPDASLMTGEAGGTIDGTPWRVPAAWRIVIRAGLRHPRASFTRGKSSVTHTCEA